MRKSDFTLTLLALIGMGLVFIPLIPGLIWFFAPIIEPENWNALLSDNQLPHAIKHTLVSAIGSTLLALLISCVITLLLYNTARWHTLQARLPLLLSFPHAAFAIGLVFLFAPSGWLARLAAIVFSWESPPTWITIHDPNALFLMLTLAFKESWFLLWVIAATLNKQAFLQASLLSKSLGYNQWQTGLHIILPQLLPKLGWPLLAVFAYSLSVVDIAQIVGPTNPPTLAQLSWQWISDPDIATQSKGSTASFLLVSLLIIVATSTQLLWQLYQKFHPYPSGKRKQHSPQWIAHLTQSLILTLGWFALLILIVWSFAGAWFFPQSLPQTFTLNHWSNADFKPLWTSLWLGISSVFISLPLVLVWLEWGPKHHQGWIYAPLILPALPLAAAQYHILLPPHFDGTAVGVIWSHLTWVVPYMLLVLTGTYRTFDQRLMTTAKTLGKSSLKSCLTVKWPILLKPILSAIAVGFAVSIAQYLPTLFAGGGRFDTVTTEAVNLSAGGKRQTLALQGLLQALLPLMVFSLAALISYQFSRKHRGV